MENLIIQFRKNLSQYKEKYPIDLLENFYNYWTKIDLKTSKMKWELEGTFDMSKRLVSWFRNTKKYDKKTNVMPLVNLMPIDWDASIGGASKDEIISSVNYIIKMIGIKEKQMPDEEQMDIIVFFLKTHFSFSSLESIKKAFESWICDEIDFKFFATDTFSAKTMASVVNIYKKKSQRENTRTGILSSSIKEKTLSTNEKAIIHNEFVKECIVRPYNHLIKTGEWIFEEISESFIYSQLLEMDIDVISEKEKQEIKLRCKTEYPEQTTKGYFAQLSNPEKSNWKREYNSKLFRRTVYHFKNEKKDLLNLLVYK